MFYKGAKIEQGSISQIFLMVYFGMRVLSADVLLISLFFSGLCEVTPIDIWQVM